VNTDNPYQAPLEHGTLRQSARPSSTWGDRFFLGAMILLTIFFLYMWLATWTQGGKMVGENWWNS